MSQVRHIARPGGILPPALRPCTAPGGEFSAGARKLHAHAIMTVLLTGVVCLALYTIVNLDFPFTGLVAIGPDAFTRLIMK